jgi:hypothetical protein
MNKEKGEKMKIQISFYGDNKINGVPNKEAYKRFPLLKRVLSYGDFQQELRKFLAKNGEGEILTLCNYHHSNYIEYAVIKEKVTKSSDKTEMASAVEITFNKKVLEFFKNDEIEVVNFFFRYILSELYKQVKNKVQWFGGARDEETWELCESLIELGAHYQWFPNSAPGHREWRRWAP